MSGGAAGPPPVRVLVVDDDPLVRAGLSMILGGVPDLRVVGEAGDGGEVPAAVEAYAPDVVLMDIRMPRVDGLAATEALRALPDPPEVLVLTTFDADDQVLRALRPGRAVSCSRTPRRPRSCGRCAGWRRVRRPSRRPSPDS